MQTKGTRSAGGAGQERLGAAGEVKAEYFGETHDMVADGRVLAWARQTATRSSFTGESGCGYTAWCHARIMQASGLHSRGTTARAETVDHDDIQVGSWSTAASADQVRGIQKRSGSQAGERMGGQQRHGCGGRRRCCEVKRANASRDTCTGTLVVVKRAAMVGVRDVDASTRYKGAMRARSGVAG